MRNYPPHPAAMQASAYQLMNNLCYAINRFWGTISPHEGVWGCELVGLQAMLLWGLQCKQGSAYFPLFQHKAVNTVLNPNIAWNIHIGLPATQLASDNVQTQEALKQTLLEKIFSYQDITANFTVIQWFPAVPGCHSAAAMLKVKLFDRTCNILFTTTKLQPLLNIDIRICTMTGSIHLPYFDGYA